MCEGSWVFDVDGCLIDSLTMSSLRPGARDLLVDLRSAGVTLHLWSAGGSDYARARAAEHGLETLFDAFHTKERRDADGRYIPWFLDRGDRTVFVDDRPEDLPIGAEFIAVAPYLMGNPHDRGLEVARRRAAEIPAR